MVLPAAEPVGRKPIGRAQSDGEFVQSPPGAGHCLWALATDGHFREIQKDLGDVPSCRVVAVSTGLLEWRAQAG